MQKVCAGRFDTSKFTNSNVGDGQTKLGSSYSGQVKPEGGERKAEKTEKTTEEQEDEEEVRAEKTEKTTEEEEEEEEEEEGEDEVKAEKNGEDHRGG